jgi:hypothetical protein
VIRLLGWVERHGRAMKLGSILGAFVLLAGGLALGMSSASGSSAPRLLNVTAPPAGKVTQPSRHYLVGTVFQSFRNGQLIVRGNGGRFFVVDYDASTAVRRDRRAVAVTNLRRGSRVTILGEPRDGRYHADIITITGMVPARPSVPPPAVTPTAPAPSTATPQ